MVLRNACGMRCHAAYTTHATTTIDTTTICIISPPAIT